MNHFIDIPYTVGPFADLNLRDAAGNPAMVRLLAERKLAEHQIDLSSMSVRLEQLQRKEQKASVNDYAGPFKSLDDCISPAEILNKAEWVQANIKQIEAQAAWIDYLRFQISHQESEITEKEGQIRATKRLIENLKDMEKENE